jgi:hypothetical protein
MTPEEIPAEIEAIKRRAGARQLPKLMSIPFESIARPRVRSPEQEEYIRRYRGELEEFKKAAGQYSSAVEAVALSRIESVRQMATAIDKDALKALMAKHGMPADDKMVEELATVMTANYLGRYPEDKALPALLGRKHFAPNGEVAPTNATIPPSSPAAFRRGLFSTWKRPTVIIAGAVPNPLRLPASPRVRLGSCS